MKRSSVERARPEQLRQPARRDVAPDLHLPHPLLGVDVALGRGTGRGGVSASIQAMPVGVAGHADGVVEPGDREAAVRRREAAQREDADEARADAAIDDDERG